MLSRDLIWTSLCHEGWEMKHLELYIWRLSSGRGKLGVVERAHGVIGGLYISAGQEYVNLTGIQLQTSFILFGT